jgi:hypothetical protein
MHHDTIQQMIEIVLGHGGILEKKRLPIACDKPEELETEWRIR